MSLEHLVQAPIEIPRVSKEVYTLTREALVKEGFTFVADIKPVSVCQLAANEGTTPFFDYINPSEKMRSNVPPQIEVAIDPSNFRIEGSNYKSADDQIKKIQEQEISLKGKLSKDVRGFISMIRPRHASILAQLDFEHQKQTGKKLFTNWFGRTDDQTVPGVVAHVGRDYQTEKLLVCGWSRSHGYPYVFAVSAVVLPRKLAA